MGHLSAEQLVDVADGTRSEASLPHLATCAACRGQLAELRATIAAAADVEVPDPSPLFWDHLSARVRDAVDADRANARGRFAWVFQRPAWSVLIYSGVAALILAAGFLAGDRSRARVEAPTLVTPPQALVGASDVDDSSLSLVADLAADLDWDAAREAGFTTHVGADEDAISLLTDAERRELRQLLQGEMTPTRRGA